MENVSTLVDFVDEYTGESMFGIDFTGIILNDYIYARRTKPSEFYNSTNYIKFPINKAKMTPASRSTAWNVPHYILEVDDELGFYDYKVKRLEEQIIPRDIFIAIEAAVKEEASTLKALHKN